MNANGQIMFGISMHVDEIRFSVVGLEPKYFPPGNPFSEFMKGSSFGVLVGYSLSYWVEK